MEVRFVSGRLGLVGGGNGIPDSFFQPSYIVRDYEFPLSLQSMKTEYMENSF